jgi:CXXX repeat modification system protein
MPEIIGKVTPGERDEIKSLFERKNGLIELFRSLAGAGPAELEKSGLYDRLVKDMGEVSTMFQAWWDGKSKKYKWPGKPGYKWQIDFDTCEIFMVKEK